MTDEEFERERLRIEGISSESALKQQIAVFQRRQLASAAHGALIGFAVVAAIEKGWVPKGTDEFKAHCKGEWGYSVSQVNAFRRLAKDWKATRRAQDLLFDNRDKLGADVKLPEVGSTAFAEKAVKFADAYDKAADLGLDDDEVVGIAEQTLEPKPKDPTAEPSAPISTRYHRLLAIVLATLKERPELEEEVLQPLVASIALQSMDDLDNWLKRETDEAIDDFYKEQHGWQIVALDPPWLVEATKPKQEPETGCQNDGRTDDPDPRPIDPPPIDPEPEPSPENLSRAVMGIWTMKDDRTCDNVAAILERFPIETWNEDNRDRLAEELWNACDPGVWMGDNEDRAVLIEIYFEHDPATKLFADEFGVLTVDEKLGLQIVSWQEIWQMMAPHIEGSRKRYAEQQRQDEANAILASKLPAKRKLKAMRERIDRLHDLKLHFPDEFRSAVDHIIAMTQDDPAFADCATVWTYLQRAGRRIGGS